VVEKMEIHMFHTIVLVLGLTLAAQAQDDVVRPAVPPENARASQQHYLSGVIYFQKQDYDKARDEWYLARELDPTNMDPRQGLDRIDRLYGPGPAAPAPKKPKAVKRKPREEKPNPASSA